MAVNTQTLVNRPAFISLHGDHAAGRALARWGIILAGGDGTRMRPLILYWLGGDRPKQFCTFVGSRSMFQHTIDRARSVVPENNVMTIVGRGHRQFLSDSANGNVPGRVLEQPLNRGTAPGVFLPIAYILMENPEATLLILPSDHFVHPEERFCEIITRAFELAERYSDKIILVGAIPNRAECDYGWITPGKRQRDGHPQSRGPMQVACFHEKPTAATAEALFQQGSLWSTMVMAVKAKALWAMGRQCLPEMMSKFDAFRTILRTVRERRLEPRYEASALISLYSGLAPADFSADILQHVSDQSMVLPMDGVAWCDWGRPQRITETLAGLGQNPHFPPEYLETTQETAIFVNERC